MSTQITDHAPSPNTEFIDVWNDILVPKFITYRHIFVPVAEQHSRVALREAAPAPGARVLDVGCGFGETTIELARHVGAEGFVVGQDCCEGFVSVGRSDATRAGVENLRFDVSDAQTDPQGEGYDYVFSRFGTMFFAGPVAALRNLRSAMVPGGRLHLLTWRRIEDNDWIGFAKGVALQRLPPPPETGETCGPGPFSQASEQLVRGQLSAAGFSDVGLRRIDAQVVVGRDVDEAIAFQLTLGPAGEIVREAGTLGEQLRPALEADLRAALRPHLTDKGVVLGSSSWSITASA